MTFAQTIKHGFGFMFARDLYRYMKKAGGTLLPIFLVILAFAVVLYVSVILPYKLCVAFFTNIKSLKLMMVFGLAFAGLVFINAVYPINLTLYGLIIGIAEFVHAGVIENKYVALLLEYGDVFFQDDAPFSQKIEAAFMAYVPIIACGLVASLSNMQDKKAELKKVQR